MAQAEVLRIDDGLIPDGSMAEFAGLVRLEDGTEDVIEAFYTSEPDGMAAYEFRGSVGSGITDSALLIRLTPEDLKPSKETPSLDPVAHYILDCAIGVRRPRDGDEWVSA